ncbi:ECF RNA polymerase sigma factor SigD [Planctomycetes bacterium Poly30]|uniref:ECF RNA polymerase sigma factor SigD n=1 Tax=Saltatorellus ferox TaxID=2528018 RepID=A0A518F0G5_9BACT|nr:ECF RNA polymerase sigma factor SigD [Planctomycetes bacterium Poly30]
MDDVDEDPALRAALEQARGGDLAAVGPLLESYRSRLARMVSIRMDSRLKGRFDTSDVLQETFVEIARRLPRYLEEEPEKKMPFFLWVRFLVGQKLLQFHRSHLGVEARAADREVPLSVQSGPGASSYSVASVWLAESGGTPSRAAVAGEEHARVQEALEGMSAMDREVLVLRHFEQLSNTEVATLLQISPQAASARYVRALTRLQSVVSDDEPG